MQTPRPPQKKNQLKISLFAFTPEGLDLLDFPGVVLNTKGFVTG